VNPKQHEEWKNAALREVFIAIASSDRLREVLIFKGARVLNQLLGIERVSLDLDSNMTTDFALEVTDLGAQAQYLEAQLRVALEEHFNHQAVVRYTLASAHVVPNPPHPLGWTAHTARIRLNDAQFARVLGLPSLEVDISPPEKLSAHALHNMQVDNHFVRAYTLERIAGEKLRAFLSSLPAYRAKVRKPGDAIRVKDLYDIARIHRARSTRDEHFWQKAGVDFRLACESRYIDCAGLTTFHENWSGTKATFETDPTLPKNVMFDEVEHTLGEIVAFMERTGVLPFAFPLPAGA
jgi:hypothetical protein